MDFYCKRLKLAIEIDGSSHDSDVAQEQDQERQTRLESFGVSFLRFREEDMRNQTHAVLEIIHEWIIQNQARG